MAFRELILYALIFALGATSISLVYEVNTLLESPTTILTAETISETLAAATTGKASEKISPGDHIQENQIKVYKDKVELDLQDVTWSKFTNTNSMDPFLDEGANGIEIAPSTASQIKVGDIVSYESSRGGVVIHRVVKIDSDSNGTYFVMKGDNNPIQDPERVRFEQVKGILVGILY